LSDTKTKIKSHKHTNTQHTQHTQNEKLLCQTPHKGITNYLPVEKKKANKQQQKKQIRKEYHKTQHLPLQQQK